MGIRYAKDLNRDAFVNAATHTHTHFNVPHPTLSRLLSPLSFLFLSHPYSLALSLSVVCSQLTVRVMGATFECLGIAINLYPAPTLCVCARARMCSKAMQ